MKTAYLHILCFLFTLLPISIWAQAPDRTAPFTAVKWAEESPLVQIEGKWHNLATLQATPATEIVTFAKQQYGNSWQKRFSEDLVIVMREMGKPLPATVTLQVEENGKWVEKITQMTTENRKKVLEYNRANPIAEPGQPNEDMHKEMQQNIANSVNLNDGFQYPFSSAKVQYQITGSNLFAGTQTLYIADHGKTVVLIIQRPKAPFAEHTTQIWKDNRSTVLNHVTRTWFTSPIRPKDTEPPTIGYSTPEQRKMGGYEEMGEEMIAGQKTLVLRNPRTDVGYWIWNALDLKMQNGALGSKFYYEKVAVTVEEGVTVPEDLFQIPSGYTQQ